MTEHQDQRQDQLQSQQPDEADNRADAWAYLCLILIAVAAVIWFVAGA